MNRKWAKISVGASALAVIALSAAFIVVSGGSPESENSANLAVPPRPSAVAGSPSLGPSGAEARPERTDNIPAPDRKNGGRTPESTKSPKDSASLAVLARGVSLWPQSSEIDALQADATAGRRSELRDPQRVAEEYLKHRFASTQAVRESRFGFRDIVKIADDFVLVPFDGALDLQPGQISLFHYGYPEGSQGDIWYVIRSESMVFPRGGAELGDSYKGGSLVQTFIPRANGRAELSIRNQLDGSALSRRTVLAKAPRLVEIKENFDKHYRIHIEVRFFSDDGRQGINEFTSGTEVV